MAKFAIIIPAYNAERYLYATLRSCVDLDVPDGCSLEIIVVDDGSSDSTASISVAFATEVKAPKKIKTLQKENGGESSAIMFGARSTDADYLVFLSSDDLIAPKLLTEAYSFFANDSEIVAVYPDWWLIDEWGQTISETKTHDWSYEEQYGRVENIPGPGTVIRSEAWTKVGGRNENFHFYSDLEQWFRLCTQGELRRLPKTLASWRTHASNQSKTTRTDQIAKEIKSLVYDFEYWQTTNLRQFEFSAKVSTHIRLALLSLDPSRPKSLKPRLNLGLSLWYYLRIFMLKGQQWVPSKRINLIEIVLLLVHPIGLHLTLLKKKINH